MRWLIRHDCLRRLVVISDALRVAYQRLFLWMGEEKVLVARCGGGNLHATPSSQGAVEWPGEIDASSASRTRVVLDVRATPTAGGAVPTLEQDEAEIMRIEPLSRREFALRMLGASGIGLLKEESSTTTVVFDGGFAPVPQDTNYDNWTNSGWPRGPVPETPTDGVEIADLRQYAQMYVGAVGAEPIYYDHPAELNGSSTGHVQIRLAAGPGAWQGAGGSVVTTYGTWSVNADGLHLSYRPKPRATGAGTDDVDTLAQYRWSQDGGTLWSTPGQLKMTLVKPPTAVLFVDDFGMTFNNLSANNTTALNNARVAAEAGNLTLTQRNGANWAVWNPTTDSSDETFHLYAVYARASVPSPGQVFWRVFTVTLADVVHDPFQLMFVDFNGRSGSQLVPETTTVWDHSSGNDPEFHTFWHCGSDSTRDDFPQANHPKYQIKYCTMYNTPSHAVLMWQNADCRARYCDFIGTHRGGITNSGSNIIWHYQDCRNLNLIKNDGRFMSKTRLYSEPDRGYGSSVFLLERVKVDQLLVMNSNHIDQGWLAGSDLQINDLWMNPEYGGETNLGAGMKLTRCRLVVSRVSHPFFLRGWSLTGGQRILSDCEIVINNKAIIESNALVAPASTDLLGCGMSWYPFTDEAAWAAAGAYGWTDRIVDTVVRLSAGMVGHTGPIYGFKLNNNSSLAVEHQSFLRLENVTFVEASDKQFTYAVEGHTSYPDLVVYYDAATAANNAALISPPDGSPQRMWGPNTIPTAI
jgi:hypothetical protein